MNDELYHDREVNHEGCTSLRWLKRDKEAFHRILIDWRDSSAEFMSEVSDFRTVVQAGGNCGMYPLFYANYFDRVISFEPDDDNYQAMLVNCPGEKFDLRKQALGAKADMVYLNNSYEANIGTHFIEDKPGSTELVTLDSLELDDCGLIHLDVEGYEGEAIKGATETILRHKPVVIIERERGAEELFKLGYKLHKRLRVDAIYVSGE